MKNANSTIFSGIKPTGTLHIGNYLGAISQWIKMQENSFCIFCVVDYHSITVYQDPSTLRENIKNIVKTYLAAGLSPEKCAIFKQSDIQEHTELAWILNCTSTRVSDLKKMTQFKDKSKNQTNIGGGLLNYPVLMAADILLYNTDYVPIGDDQIQHLELTKTIARRFNNTYGEIFKLPKTKLNQQGARIMGLDDPNQKMSKSATSEANFVSLLDDPEQARKKVKKAVTDSENSIYYNPETKPAISNLLVIYSLLADKPINDLVEEYKDKGYGDLKQDLAEVVVSFLHKFQEQYNNISDDQVSKVLQKGREKIEKTAYTKVKEVKKAIGIK